MSESSDDEYENISEVSENEGSSIDLDVEYDTSILGEEDEQNFYEKYDINNNITENILNKYEKTKILIERTHHLTEGAPPYISVENFNSYYDIALEELKQKKLPYIIKRVNGDIIDYWKLDDLILNI